MFFMRLRYDEARITVVRRKRDGFIKKYGDNIWYRFHGTLDYVWMGLVICGLIVNSNRLFHLAVLATFWAMSFAIFYAPRWIKKWDTRWRI